MIYVMSGCVTKEVVMRTTLNDAELLPILTGVGLAGVVLVVVAVIGIFSLQV